MRSTVVFSAFEQIKLNRRHVLKMNAEHDRVYAAQDVRFEVLYAEHLSIPRLCPHIIAGILGFA